MNKLLKIFIPIFLASTFLQSQSLQGNVEVNAITVHYTYVARAADSPEDTTNGGGGTVSVSWPSSAEPKAVGKSKLPQYSFIRKEAVSSHFATISKI